MPGWFQRRTDRSPRLGPRENTQPDGLKSFQMTPNHCGCLSVRPLAAQGHSLSCNQRGAVWGKCPGSVRIPPENHGYQTNPAVRDCFCLCSPQHVGCGQGFGTAQFLGPDPSICDLATNFRNCTAAGRPMRSSTIAIPVLARDRLSSTLSRETHGSILRSETPVRHRHFGQP